MQVFFKILLRIMALLPLRVAHCLGTITGWFYYIIPHNYQFAIKKNLQICFPELDSKQAKQLRKRCFIETSKAVWELGALWTWPIHKLLPTITTISGLTLLEEALKKGKGVILAAPHLGCWEIIGAFCSNRYSMTSMYRPSRISSMDKIIRHARQRFGAQLVPTNNRGIRGLYKALHENQIIGVLPDQDPRNEGNVFAPFFGFNTNTATLLPRFANKTNATVLFTYAERLPDGKGYHIHFLPAPAGINDDDINIAAAAMNRGVEQCIRAIPEQYQWTYKRFKTRPEGEKKFY